MQTVDALKHKTRSELIHIVYSFTVCILIIELIVLLIYYPLGRLSCTVPRYILRYMLLPTAWNFSMCFLLTKINSSLRIDENHKIVMMIFCITKICASVAVVHAYFLPVQCVFVAAIIAAALIGNSRLIVFACTDSLAMLALSVFLSQLFNIEWSLGTRIESALMSAIILIMTSIISNTIVKTRHRSNVALERYIANLEKATKEAKLDMMTGLYNHAEFYNILRKQIVKDVNKISVAIIDIDHFKDVNDSYGHDNGDKVILRIADYARKINDDESVYVSRYGGEEFAFIFVDTPKEKAIAYLQNIRKCVKDCRFDFDESKAITISIGVFECRPKSYEPEDIFSNADLALYYSKEHGRDQLNVYNELSDEEIGKMAVKH